MKFSAESFGVDDDYGTSLASRENLDDEFGTISQSYTHDVKLKRRKQNLLLVVQTSVEEEPEIPNRVLSSLKNALRLLKLLPDSFPEPEFSVDPDGDISFEWINSPFRYICLNVGDNDIIHYACLNETDSFNGKSIMGGTFPKTLKILISEIIGNEY